MGSLEDHYDNGILKSLLAKVVNSTAVPVYPRTSAEIVSYGESNVKAKLDSLNNTVINLQNLTSTISANITDLANSRYDRTYIDLIISSINDQLVTIKEQLTVAQGTLDGLNVYTKEEINDKVSRLTGDLSQAQSVLDARISELSAYLVNNYDNKNSIASFRINLESKMDNLKNAVDTELEDSIEDFKNEINSWVTGIVAEYYTKEDINGMMSTVNNNISGVNTAVEDLREETTSMNATSVNEINNHIDEENSEMLQSIDTKFGTNLESVQEKIDSQTSQIEVMIETLKGTINNINSSVAAQIANISGGSSGGVVYQNADEEAY